MAKIDDRFDRAIDRWRDRQNDKTTDRGPYFFLSDVSDSGGIPTTRTVPFSTSLGAAMMRGSSLHLLFFVLTTTITCEKSLTRTRKDF